LDDIASLEPTPYETLAAQEEKDKDCCIIYAVDALSALISYLLKDLRPSAIAARVLLLAYTIRPEIINGMNLEEIGKIVGCSRQNLSQKLETQDNVFTRLGRNRRPEELKSLQRHNWHKKLAANPTPKKEKNLTSRQEYQKLYRERNKEKAKAYREAYQKAKKELLK